MKLTLKEMNGLLNGKCLPSDLIVGETLAEYLVRKFSALEQRLIESERYGRQTDITIDNLEMKLAQMAADNAGLKKSTPDIQTMMTALDVFFADDEVPERAMLAAYNLLRDAVPTPATDAFLAEVRAQGVDAAIDIAKNVVAQEFQYKDFETAQRVCSKSPDSDLVGKVEMVEWLEEFSTHLRKGVQS